jgi:Helix-turn-helix domain
MYDLTKQELRIYNYLLVHPGATTREIINATYITCPSGRIAEMRKKGVPIISLGQRKYEGARPFEMYAVDTSKPKPTSATELAEKPLNKQELDDYYRDLDAAEQQELDDYYRDLDAKQQHDKPAEVAEQAKQLALSMTA